MGNTEFEHVYFENVIEFVKVTNDFCLFLENSKDLSRKNIINKLQKLLTLLYSKAILLPAVESVLDDVNEKFVTENDWEFINDTLRKKIGSFNEFLEVFDPRMAESVEPIVVSISENLADIYQDIKNFIMLYQVGTNEIMNDALWECNNSFKEYWGQKTLNTLRAIHNLINNENLEDEEEDL